jgi:hypothetical protein
VVVTDLTHVLGKRSHAHAVDRDRKFDRLTEQLSSAGRSFMAMDASREADEYFAQIDVPGDRSPR